MYYKVFLDGVMIDALRDPLIRVQWSDRAGMVLRSTDERRAQGILSDRTGRYYHVYGWPAFPEGTNSGGTVQLWDVTEEEYLAAIGQLDAEDPEDADPVLPEDSEEEPMTRAELTAKVNELDEALELILSGVTE